MAITWLTVAVAILGIIAIPTFALVFRLVIRWTHIEDKQNQIIKDVEDLAAELREDRKATDGRLRQLEQRAWRRRLLSSRYQVVMVL